MENFLLIIVSIFISATIAAAGGIAGGGVIVPLLLVVGGYQFRQATILSLSTVFGNYIAQALINIQQRHPRVVERPLIHWDVILILLPPLLGGANLGVLFAKILPSTLLQITSATVIVYAIHKSYKSFKSHWKEENHQRFIITHGYQTANIEEPNENDIEKVSTNQIETCDGEQKDDLDFSRVKRSTTNKKSYLHEDFEDGYDSEGSFTSKDTEVESGYPMLEIIPSLVYPWKSIQVLSCIWLAFVAFFVILQHISACSYTYFSLLVVVYPVLGFIVVSSIAYVSDRQKFDPLFNYTLGDLDFRDKSTRMPYFAFIIGILCALLGIGGGELMGPLFLVYHVSPQVTAATVSMMSLLTTSSNVLHYIILGDIDIKLSMMLFAVGLTAGFIGRRTALYVTEKLQRSSILILMLTTILSASLLLLLYNATLKEVDWSFHSMCT